jgi:beta-phosphoglucomutase-like phosphatase (HAD superfamily)
MSDDLDRARENIDEAREKGARLVAILISVLAAGLAIFEMQEKAAQTQYMSRNIQVSDDYAFYQAKTVRSNTYALHAELLADLPNAADPAIKKQIEDARAMVARLDDDPKTDGRKQLLASVEQHKTQRERQGHRYELFELVVGGLQIAIVLASVSIVTRMSFLAAAAGALGLFAMAAGGLIWASVL